MKARSIGARTLMTGVAALTLVVSIAAIQLSEVGIVLKSQNTIGTRPDGSTVLIDIKLEVVGPNVFSLTGTGRHFGSGGLHAYWDVTGEIVENILRLTGTVQDTNNPVYLGSPIRVEADLTTEIVTFAFGPLTGGPFAGHTIVTEGSGKIQIRNREPRNVAGLRPGVVSRAPG